jgi:hypothetical protein
MTLLLSELLDELLLEIAALLDGKDLISATAVCTRFYELFQEESLWFRCVQNERPIKYKSPEMSWKEHYALDLGKAIRTNSICEHFNIFSKENVPGLLRRLDDLTDQQNAKQKVGESIVCGIKGCKHGFNNLWLCSFKGCGHVGCGRRDNAHALGHAHEHNHPISLKLNTMEMWCYFCSLWVGMEEDSRHHIEVERYNELRKYFIQGTKSGVSDELTTRRKVERGLRMGGQFGDKWAVVIPMAFETAYERFIIGDSGPYTEPLDTKCLLDANGRFNPNMRPRIDYMAVSFQAWEYFKGAYNGASSPVILTDLELTPTIRVNPPDYEALLQDEIKRDEEEKIRKEKMKADMLLNPSEDDFADEDFNFDDDTDVGNDNGNANARGAIQLRFMNFMRFLVNRGRGNDQQ